MAPFSGGMEHQTMTSQGFFEFSVDAHELCHQWFGDNVTCQTWRDIWVNEGFAAYSEYLAIEYFYPAYKDLNMNFVHESVMSQPDGAIWFSDSTNVARIFDGRLTYDKGGAIIHTLRYLCNNDSLFFNGLKTYQNTFKNATATAEDLKSTMQTVSGVNLTDWMNNWFYGEGYPTYDVRWNQVGKNLYVHVSHTTSAPSTPLFKTPIEIKFNSPTGDTIIRFNISSNNEDFLVELANKTIDSLIVDPNNWIINRASTAKDETLALMENVQENNYRIYPTLVKDNIQISSNLSANVILKLLDMSGKQLETRQFNTSALIDMQQYAAGTYSVIITDANGRTIKIEKVIKQ
jgi:aminopeptidase N